MVALAADRPGHESGSDRVYTWWLSLWLSANMPVQKNDRQRPGDEDGPEIYFGELTDTDAVRKDTPERVQLP